MEWSRLFNDILQISWPFLSEIVSGLEKHEPTLRSREEDPIEGSDDDTGYIDGRELSNVDDTEAWNLANEHLFSVLRLTTTGAARSVLLQFESKYGGLVVVVVVVVFTLKTVPISNQYLLTSILVQLTQTPPVVTD